MEEDTNDTGQTDAVADCPIAATSNSQDTDNESDHTVNDFENEPVPDTQETLQKKTVVVRERPTATWSQVPKRDVSVKVKAADTIQQRQASELVKQGSKVPRRATPETTVDKTPAIKKVSNVKVAPPTPSRVVPRVPPTPSKVSASTPRKVTITSSKITPTPSRVTTTPSRVTTTPSRVTTTPSRVTTNPSRVTTPPSRVTTTPSRVTTTPSRVTTTPSRLTSTPSRLTSTPSRLTSTPSRLTSTPSRLTSTPSRLTSTPSRPTSTPSRPTSTPSRLTSTPSRITPTTSRVTLTPSRVVSGPSKVASRINISTKSTPSPKRVSDLSKNAGNSSIQSHDQILNSRDTSSRSSQVSSRASGTYHSAVSQQSSSGFCTDSDSSDYTTANSTRTVVASPSGENSSKQAQETAMSRLLRYKTPKTTNATVSKRGTTKSPRIYKPLVVTANDDTSEDGTLTPNSFMEDWQPIVTNGNYCVVDSDDLVDSDATVTEETGHKSANTEDFFQAELIQAETTQSQEYSPWSNVTVYNVSSDADKANAQSSHEDADLARSLAEKGPISRSSQENVLEPRVFSPTKAQKNSEKEKNLRAKNENNLLTILSNAVDSIADHDSIGEIRALSEKDSLLQLTLLEPATVDLDSITATEKHPDEGSGKRPHTFIDTLADNDSIGDMFADTDSILTNYQKSHDTQPTIPVNQRKGNPFLNAIANFFDALADYDSIADCFSGDSIFARNTSPTPPNSPLKSIQGHQGHQSDGAPPADVIKTTTRISETSFSHQSNTNEVLTNEVVFFNELTLPQDSALHDIPESADMPTSSSPRVSQASSASSGNKIAKAKMAADSSQSRPPWRPTAHNIYSQRSPLDPPDFVINRPMRRVDLHKSTPNFLGGDGQARTSSTTQDHYQAWPLNTSSRLKSTSLPGIDQMEVFHDRPPDTKGKYGLKGSLKPRQLAPYAIEEASYSHRQPELAVYKPGLELRAEAPLRTITNPLVSEQATPSQLVNQSKMDADKSMSQRFRPSADRSSKTTPYAVSDTDMDVYNRRSPVAFHSGMELRRSVSPAFSDVPYATESHLEHSLSNFPVAYEAGMKVRPDICRPVESLSPFALGYDPLLGNEEKSSHKGHMNAANRAGSPVGRSRSPSPNRSSDSVHNSSPQIITSNVSPLDASADMKEPRTSSPLVAKPTNVSVVKYHLSDENLFMESSTDGADVSCGKAGSVSPAASQPRSDGFMSDDSIDVSPRRRRKLLPKRDPLKELFEQEKDGNNGDESDISVDSIDDGDSPVKRSRFRKGKPTLHLDCGRSASPAREDSPSSPRKQVSFQIDWEPAKVVQPSRLVHSTHTSESKPKASNTEADSTLDSAMAALASTVNGPKYGRKSISPLKPKVSKVKEHNTDTLVFGHSIDDDSRDSFLDKKPVSQRRAQSVDNLVLRRNLENQKRSASNDNLNRRLADEHQKSTLTPEKNDSKMPKRSPVERKIAGKIEVSRLKPSTNVGSRIDSGLNDISRVKSPEPKKIDLNKPVLICKPVSKIDTGLSNRASWPVKPKEPVKAKPVYIPMKDRTPRTLQAGKPLRTYPARISSSMGDLRTKANSLTLAPKLSSSLTDISVQTDDGRLNRTTSDVAIQTDEESLASSCDFLDQGVGTSDYSFPTGPGSHVFNIVYGQPIATQTDDNSDEPEKISRNHQQIWKSEERTTRGDKPSKPLKQSPDSNVLLEFDVLQRSDSHQPSFQQSEPHPSSFLRSEPHQSSFHDSEPQQSSFQPSEPHKSSSQRPEPHQSSFQRSEPIQTSFHGSEPQQSSFQQSEPQQSSFQRSEPQQSSFQRSEPQRSSFQKSEPLQTSFHGSEPQQSSFQRSEPQQSSFQLSEPQQKSFQRSEPQRSSFQKSEPLQTSFHGSEPLQSSYRSSDGKPQNSELLLDLDPSANKPIPAKRVAPGLKNRNIGQDWTDFDSKPQSNNEIWSIQREPAKNEWKSDSGEVLLAPMKPARDATWYAQQQALRDMYKPRDTDVIIIDAQPADKISFKKEEIEKKVNKPTYSDSSTIVSNAECNNEPWSPPTKDIWRSREETTQLINELWPQEDTSTKHEPWEQQEVQDSVQPTKDRWYQQEAKQEYSQPIKDLRPQQEIQSKNDLWAQQESNQYSKPPKKDPRTQQEIIQESKQGEEEPWAQQDSKPPKHDRWAQQETKQDSSPSKKDTWTQQESKRETTQPNKTEPLFVDDFQLYSKPKEPSSGYTGRNESPKLQRPQRVEFVVSVKDQPGFSRRGSGSSASSNSSSHSDKGPDFIRKTVAKKRHPVAKKAEKQRPETFELPVEFYEQHRNQILSSSTSSLSTSPVDEKMYRRKAERRSPQIEERLWKLDLGEVDAAPLATSSGRSSPSVAPSNTIDGSEYGGLADIEISIDFEEERKEDDLIVKMREIVTIDADCKTVTTENVPHIDVSLAHLGDTPRGSSVSCNSVLDYLSDDDQPKISQTYGVQISSSSESEPEGSIPSKLSQPVYASTPVSFQPPKEMIVSRNSSSSEDTVTDSESHNDTESFVSEKPIKTQFDKRRNYEPDVVIRDNDRASNTQPDVVLFPDLVEKDEDEDEDEDDDEDDYSGERLMKVKDRISRMQQKPEMQTTSKDLPTTTTNVRNMKSLFEQKPSQPVERQARSVSPVRSPFLVRGRPETPPSSDSENERRNGTKPTETMKTVNGEQKKRKKDRKKKKERIYDYKLDKYEPRHTQTSTMNVEVNNQNEKKFVPLEFQFDVKPMVIIDKDNRNASKREVEIAPQNLSRTFAQPDQDNFQYKLHFSPMNPNLVYSDTEDMSDVGNSSLDEADVHDVMSIHSDSSPNAYYTGAQKPTVFYVEQNGDPTAFPRIHRHPVTEMDSSIVSSDSSTSPAGSLRGARLWTGVGMYGSSGARTERKLSQQSDVHKMPHQNVEAKQQKVIRKMEHSAPRQDEEEFNELKGPQVFVAGNAGENACTTCGNRVYEMEKLVADKQLYHKTCFKCSKCKRTLGIGNYATNEGKLLCKPHFMELFRLRGHYEDRWSRENTPEYQSRIQRDGVRPDEGEDGEGQIVRSEDKLVDDRENMPSLKNIKSRFENADENKRQAERPQPGKLKQLWNADEARNRSEVSPSPPRDPDIVREQRLKEEVPITSGGIRNIKQQYLESVKKPESSKAPPPPVEIPRQEFKRSEPSPSPSRDPDVVRSDDVMDEGQYLPPPQMTKGLVARFKQMEVEQQGQASQSPQRRPPAPANNVHAAYRKPNAPTPEPRFDLLDEERQIPDSGEFENQPNYREDVVREWDEGDGQDMPEVGAAKARINMFRQIERENVVKPPPSFGEMYQPSSGAPMVNGDPRQQNRGKVSSDKSVNGSPSRSQPDVIRHEEYNSDERPPQDLTKSMLSKFRQLETQAKSQKEQEWISPRRNEKSNEKPVTIASKWQPSVNGQEVVERPLFNPACPEGGEYENNPIDLPDVVRESDPYDENELPEVGVTRNLLAKFQSMQT